MNPPVILELLYSYRLAGSERVGATLAECFRQRGYEVICAALYEGEGPLRASLEAAGIRCASFDLVARGRFGRLSFEYDFARFLHQQRVAVIHAHHCSSLPWCGPVARLLGRRFVVTEHTDFDIRASRGYTLRTRIYQRLAQHITIIHDGLRSFFRDTLGYPDARLLTIPNGIAPREARSTRESARREIGWDPQRLTLLFVGRLHPDKDVATLLRAFAAAFPESRSRPLLKLAGEGEQRALLASLVDELGLAAEVELLGNRSDVDQLLAAADVFVMSSRTEGVPMALLEAMAQGLPCVSTAVGGIPSVLQQGAGLLVPAQQVPALATALQQVCADASLRARLGAAAEQRARSEYALEAVVDRYLAAFGLPPRWPG